MKRTLTTALSSILFLSTMAQKTADEVVAKLIDAMGGKEKLQSIKTVKRIGYLEQGGQKIPFNYYCIHSKAERTEISFNGLTYYQVVTKDSGYNFNPFQGMQTPERMTAEDVKQAQDELDQQSVLLDYASKGHTVELLDREDVDGVDAIQLKINLASGKTLFYYIDPDNYYIIRIKIKGRSNGQEFTNTADYYNFKKNKDGILFAYTQDNITFEDIEVNGTIDEKIFAVKK
jgi:hypothetical protein